MRDNRVLNRRSQDGLKLPLLCAGCEERFTSWETNVAERIFPPFSRTQKICTLPRRLVAEIRGFGLMALAHLSPGRRKGYIGLPEQITSSSRKMSSELEGLHF
jgi:hypothetical protein